MEEIVLENKVLQLCNECAAKARLAFPKKEVRQIGSGMERVKCGICKKSRLCLNYELKNKEKVTKTKEG
jgi:hypothetical protein